jgi:hypothetical protein
MMSMTSSKFSERETAGLREFARIMDGTLVDCEHGGASPGPARAPGAAGPGGRMVFSEPPAPPSELMACARALPNTTVSWNAWKDTAMRFYAAGHGADYSFDAFRLWSDKIHASVPGHVPARTPEECWREVTSAPPTRTGMGALINQVRAATGQPEWQVTDDATYMEELHEGLKPYGGAPGYRQTIEPGEATHAFTGIDGNPNLNFFPPPGGNGGAPPPNGATAQPPPPFPHVSLRINWLPTTRKLATEQLGVGLAQRCERLFTYDERLVLITRPDDSLKKLKHHIVDPSLPHARRAEAITLIRAADEAGVQFLGAGRGRPKKDTDKPGPAAADERLVPVHPPKDPFEMLIRTPALCPARPLAAIACVPCMEDDGTLVQVAGYDESTGIWHHLDGLPLLTLPDRPDKADLDRAVAAVFHPFSLFHTGSTPDDRTRWLGQVLTMVLTAVERPFLDNAPLIMVNGTIAGVGKGKVCQTVSIVAYGRRGDLITSGENAEEFKKRIDTALISGAPSILIDNANNLMIKADTLASILTEGEASIRAFGSNSDAHKVRGRRLLMVNGNNVTASQDMARKTLTVRLETETADPEARTFAFDPVTQAKARRGEILTACFALMRWWRQQNRPAHTVMGSFEEWSYWVGDLVHALTGWHPVPSILENKLSDPFREHVSAALQALFDRFQGHPFRASDVAGICTQVGEAQRRQLPHVATTRGFAPEHVSQDQLAMIETDLAEAMPLVTERGSTSARAIGEWLARMENATHGTFVVQRWTEGERTAKIIVSRRGPAAV